MVRKATSEGKRTSVTLRFSGARLHIRNRGMKPILHKQELKYEVERYHLNLVMASKSATLLGIGGNVVASVRPSKSRQL